MIASLSVAGCLFSTTSTIPSVSGNATANATTTSVGISPSPSTASASPVPSVTPSVTPLVTPSPSPSVTPTPTPSPAPVYTISIGTEYAAPVNSTAITFYATVFVNGQIVPASNLANQINWYNDNTAAGGNWEVPGFLTLSGPAGQTYAVHADFLVNGQPVASSNTITGTFQ